MDLIIDRHLLSRVNGFFIEETPLWSVLTSLNDCLMWNITLVKYEFSTMICMSVYPMDGGARYPFTLTSRDGENAPTFGLQF